MKKLIYHWFSLRYICYICYGGKRWPRIFSRYFCFFWSHHSQCMFHSLLSLCWFLLGPWKTLLLLFHIANVEKADLSLIFPLLRGKKMAQNFFSLRLFLLASSLSMYFPFVTFITLISKWTRKNLLLLFHILNVEKDDLSLIFPTLHLLPRKKKAQNFFSLPLFLLELSLSVYFPFVTFVMLISTWTKKNPVTFVSYFKCWKGWFIIDFPFVTGEKDGPKFFLVTFVSSSVITLYVFSIRYFHYTDFKMDHILQNLLLLIHILNVEKDDLSLIFPTLHLLHLLRRKKMAQNFFSLPLFLLELSLSVYFPFVTFIMLISTWNRKKPVSFFSYFKCWKRWFIIDFPFVIFVTEEKDGPEFFLITFVPSGVFILSVFSIRYFR